MEGLLGGLVGGASQIVQRNQQMDKEDETTRLETMRSDLQLSRQKAIEDYKIAKSEEMAGKVNFRAKEIASTRMTTPDEVSKQADSAAVAYGNARNKGLISQEDEAKAATAITEYSRENSVPDTKVTVDDRMQAATEFGAIPITPMATYSHQKEQDLINNKRADNQHADNIKRMDIQLATQENNFKQSMAAAERQSAAIENSTKRQELNAQNAAAKIQFDASKTEYEGISKQIVEMQRNGETPSPAYTDLVKGLSKAKAGMNSAYMMIGGKSESTSGGGYSSLWGAGETKQPDNKQKPDPIQKGMLVTLPDEKDKRNEEKSTKPFLQVGQTAESQQSKWDRYKEELKAYENAPKELQRVMKKPVPPSYQR